MVSLSRVTICPCFHPYARCNYKQWLYILRSMPVCTHYMVTAVLSHYHQGNIKLQKKKKKVGGGRGRQDKEEKEKLESQMYIQGLLLSCSYSLLCILGFCPFSSKLRKWVNPFQYNQNSELKTVFKDLLWIPYFPKRKDGFRGWGFYPNRLC